MKNINKLIETARRGEAEHDSAIFSHIDSFQEIILRGAGKFGTEFGVFLLQHGTAAEKLTYWDIRANELITLNGLPVRQPFSPGGEKDKTLVINCIPNGSLSGSVGQKEFFDAGYENYLSGMALFEALMCDIKPETGFRPEVCIKTTFCNWCACKRLPSMLYRDCKEKVPATVPDKLVFTVATFAISQKCTLQCTHCGQYINHYAADERVNFPLERILTDIDRIFSAVDAIGYVSIIGGEPFLHPALNEIVGAILSKPNFGVLGITTNGICEINDQHLQFMQNGRIRVIFSDYTAALSEKQKGLFKKNLDKVAAAGISHTVGQPLWSTPPSLLDQKFPEEIRIAMKTGCNSTETCKTIQNGVYYPCSTTAGVGSHHIADYSSTDWVNIDQTKTATELRTRIQLVDNRTQYQSCNHCAEGGDLLSMPGKQGTSRRYIHIGKR
jgi:hypothetical protein